MRYAALLPVVALFMGCGAAKGPSARPATLVDVVIQGDFVTPGPVAWLTGHFVAGPGPVMPLTAVEFDDPAPPFPVTVEFLIVDDVPGFSVLVQLNKDPNPGVQVPAPVVSWRSMRDIRPVKGDHVMFVLPMLTKCLCQGTDCPAPGDPDCDDVVSPVPVAYDQDVAGLPRHAFSL